jgi:hypothetical protein
LTTELSLTPLEGRFRVAVISSAHRLNPDAQNALLKTLEEPGPATCLVLCADDMAPLLPTVVSRAARLRLGTPTLEVLSRWWSTAASGPGAGTRHRHRQRGRPLALRLASRPATCPDCIGRTLLTVTAGRRTAWRGQDRSPMPPPSMLSRGDVAWSATHRARRAPPRRSPSSISGATSGASGQSRRPVPMVSRPRAPPGACGGHEIGMLPRCDASSIASTGSCSPSRATLTRADARRPSYCLARPRAP